MTTRTEIDRIKETTDLAAYIRSRGIALVKRGKDLAGLCPFHDDHNPSMIITPAKQLYRCVSCGAGGDIIEFVMKLDRLPFQDAIERLRQYKGIAAIEPEHEEAETIDLRDITADENRILLEVVEHYERGLRESTRAKEYLTGRGIKSGETIKQFRIGFCTEGLLKMLPSKNTDEGKRYRDVLTKYGIIRETGREHFRGCITFPILDEHGNYRGMYGRRIQSGSRIPHLYATGSNRGLYNPAAYGQEELILCESILDALTFHANGILNVSCIYGVNGYTDELHETILRSKVRTVHVALDGDEAGNGAADAIIERLTGSGTEALRVVLPSQTDINEYALKMPPAEESLRALIKNAKNRSPLPAPFSPSVEQNEKTIRKENPVSGNDAFVAGEEVHVTYDNRSYRVRGLFKNKSDHQMKINLRVSAGDMIYVDTLDFLSAKARQHYVTNSSIELSIQESTLKTDLSRLLDTLERLQESHQTEEPIVEIPPDRKERALKYLKDPDLIRNIVSDFEHAGLAGERINALVGYLGVISRKTEMPLAIIIQSSSSAGKSTLMESILAFVPEEDKIKYSFMTGQSLYYMQSRDLKYKIIAISEEEGLERAKYAVKILQSERKITIATTVKDPVTGHPDTREFTVEGPVMFILTTTSVEIDEEIQNRSVILTVNETREQTRLIQRLQRESQTLEGILRKKEKSHLSELHSDCQRLLQPYEIVNPYVTELDFPDHNLRTRRDQMKFLTLIHAIVLLHQHQRERTTGKTVSGEEVECLVATKEDVALAAFLAGEVFGISMDDLAPQTRQLLLFIDEFVKKKSEETHKIRFTRRELRESIRWTDTRIRRHLDRLVDLELVIAYGGGQGKLTEYELHNPAAVSADSQNAALFFLPESVQLPDEKLVRFLKNGESVEEKSNHNGSSPLQDPTSSVKTATSSPLRRHFATPERRSENGVKQRETPESRNIDPTSPPNPERIFKAENSGSIGIASTDGGKP